MNFNKGKLKNVNKKLLAGGLALIMVGASLAGCSKSNYNSLDCATDDEVEADNNDRFAYYEICLKKVVVFEYDEKCSIYLTTKTDDGWGLIKYINIFNDQVIYSTGWNTKLNIVSEELFADYLVIYNRVQDYYTEEELKELLEQIKVDYEKENNKQLVKEK